MSPDELYDALRAANPSVTDNLRRTARHRVDELLLEAQEAAKPAYADAYREDAALVAALCDALDAAEQERDTAARAAQLLAGDVHRFVRVDAAEQARAPGEPSEAAIDAAVRAYNEPYTDESFVTPNQWHESLVRALRAAYRVDFPAVDGPAAPPEDPPSEEVQRWILGADESLISPHAFRDTPAGRYAKTVLCILRDALDRVARGGTP